MKTYQIYYRSPKFQQYPAESYRPEGWVDGYDTRQSAETELAAMRATAMAAGQHEYAAALLVAPLE